MGFSDIPFREERVIEMSRKFSGDKVSAGRSGEEIVFLPVAEESGNGLAVIAGNGIQAGLERRFRGADDGFARHIGERG